jgi:hypothetical protein
VASVLAPLIQHGADAANHLGTFGGASKNADSRLEGVGKVPGILAPAFIAVQAITNALMAANLVGPVVIAIATLAAGFVLAYNKLKPFHDAVNRMPRR